MGDILGGILVVFVWFCALAGWVLNIVYLVEADSIGGLEVARIIGILAAPLGSILGIAGLF